MFCALIKKVKRSSVWWHLELHVHKSELWPEPDTLYIYIYIHLQPYSWHWLHFLHRKSHGVREYRETVSFKQQVYQILLLSCQRIINGPSNAMQALTWPFHDSTNTWMTCIAHICQTMASCFTLGLTVITLEGKIWMKCGCDLTAWKCW